jgi:hypothetical protein
LKWTGKSPFCGESREGFGCNNRYTLNMNWLKKLPGSPRSASGLEWRLWRKLPVIALTGTLLPLLVLVAVYLFNDPQAGAADARWTQMVGYMVLGAILFHWFMVVTVALGCIIVMIMKGPGYVADGFSVSHSDQPRKVMESAEEARHRRSPFP